MEKLIFFVDDDKMILNLLEYTVKTRFDYHVKTFNYGENCLENMTMNPDLIVLDYIFLSDGNEKMSGMDVLTEIRKKYKKLPVIILSGNEDDGLEMEFLNKGASKFLCKNNYFIDALVETINTHLS